MEEKLDKKLGIRTQGIREWRGHTLYNRCESTPYKALETLFKSYHLSKGDSLVDYGSGRGRVAFYIHNKFDVPITGVELNELTIDEALENRTRYLSNLKDYKSNITFEFGYAENYDIKKEDNKFYFFNPFQSPIFEKVVDRIIESANKHDKIVEIILYYPMPGYKEYLDECTDFELIDKIFVEDRIDKREKFLIYRYDLEHINRLKNKERKKKNNGNFVLKFKGKRK